MTDKIIQERGLVRRHGMVELLEHWTIAVSGIILILTGLLELPVGRRYYITEIPGFTWAGDFFVTLYLHYAAAVVFVTVALFHLFYHGLLGDGAMLPRRGDLKASIAVIKTFFGKGEEPPFEKYLPEQRLAYAGMAFIIVMLIISGLVKTYVNLINPQLSHTVALLATWIHNIGFVLFILAFIAHIGALILKPNRPLVRSMFTGSVRLDYARKRHPLWISAIEEKQQFSTAGGAIDTNRGTSEGDVDHQGMHTNAKEE